VPGAEPVADDLAFRRGNALDRDAEGSELIFVALERAPECGLVLADVVAGYVANRGLEGDGGISS
jgi:hypothetical protein